MSSGEPSSSPVTPPPPNDDDIGNANNAEEDDGGIMIIDGVDDSTVMEALAAAIGPQMKELETLMDDPLLKSSQSENELLAMSRQQQNGAEGLGGGKRPHQYHQQQRAIHELAKQSSLQRIISDDETIHTVQPDDITVSTHKINSRGGKNNIQKTNSSGGGGGGGANDSDDEYHLEDDDMMDQEMEQLAFAEDMLRRELDMAKDFATFFGTDQPGGGGAAESESSSGMNFMSNINLYAATPKAGNNNSSMEPSKLFQTQQPQQKSQQEEEDEAAATNAAAAAAAQAAAIQAEQTAAKIRAAVESYTTLPAHLQSTAASQMTPPPSLTQPLPMPNGNAASQQHQKQIRHSMPASVAQMAAAGASINQKVVMTGGEMAGKVPTTAEDPSNPFAPTVAVPTLTVQQDEADLDGDDDAAAVEEGGGGEEDHNHANTNTSNFDGSFNPKEAIRNAQQETLHFENPTASGGAGTPSGGGAMDSAAKPASSSPIMNQSPLVTTTGTEGSGAGGEASLSSPQLFNVPAVASSSSGNAPATPATNTSTNTKYKTPRSHQSYYSAPETPQTSVVLFKDGTGGGTPSSSAGTTPNANTSTTTTTTYTSTEHFQKLQLRKEPQGAWYSVDLTLFLVNSYSNTTFREMNEEESFLMAMGSGMGIKEYCLSITQWKRLFVGLRLEGDEERQQQRKLQKQQQQQQQQQGGEGEQQQPSSTTPSNNKQKPQQQATSPNDTTTATTTPSDDPTSKRAPVRTVSIRIRPDVLCGAVMDAVTQTLVTSPNSEIIKRQGGHLQATVRGQIPLNTTSTTNTPATMRDSSASRRSTWTAGMTTPPRRRNQQEKQQECTFFVDVQLCTHKSSHCERVLLLRIFHHQTSDGGTQGDMWSPSNTATPASTSAAAASSTTPASQNIGEETEEEEFDADSVLMTPEKDRQQQQNRANLHLREACALIQRIESPELAKKIRPLSRKSAGAADANNLRELVSEHLLHNYRACPSVLQPDTAITLPALSPQDWPVIQSTWGWIQSVWDELETRELTYLSFLPMSWMTMATTTTTTSMSPNSMDSVGGFETPGTMSGPPVPRFGAFPALPTLDVQYCSQLRRLSREGMIGQLLKAASVLEDYARQAEYQCANLIDLLRPTFAYYEVEPPSLPKPAPLASYPLDYAPPQSLCPPWGMKVMEALNQVAAMSHNSTTDLSPIGGGDKSKDALAKSLESIHLAEMAVQMVYEAFQHQDDEEHSARLARKNLQVMDRLNKMQEHNRSSIQALGWATTRTATAAADDFFSKAENAIIGLHKTAPSSSSDEQVECCTTPWREVPLLKWTLGVGGSSGTCTITPNQLLFTPAKLIPLLGPSQSTWFFLGDVEFDLVQTQATLLNPLTTTLKVLERHSGAETYSFKPSSAGQRLKSFLDIVQKEACVASERRDSRGGDNFTAF